MTEKPQTQINNTQELLASSQDLSRVVMSKKNIYNNSSKLSEQLTQDLIDYRYEQARIERKRVRESKGQSFEQYVNEIVAKKEKSKTKPEPKRAEQSKTNNSILQRLKGLAALAFVSGSMMLTSCNMEGNKPRSETKNPIKTEQVQKSQQIKKVEQTNQTQTKKVGSGYTSSKFKFTIPNVEASNVKTGTIVNEYRSNGVSFKGRFVMMPNGALFNLEGRSIKITPKNIYAVENDRSGYFNLNDTKATKKVTPGQKISILNSEIVLVPDIQDAKKVETKKVVTQSRVLDNISPIEEEHKSKLKQNKLSEILKPQKSTVESNHPTVNNIIITPIKKHTIGNIALLIATHPSDSKSYKILDSIGYNVSDNYFNNSNDGSKKVIIPIDIPDSNMIKNLYFSNSKLAMKDLKMRVEYIQVENNKIVKIYFLEITKPKTDFSNPEIFLEKVSSLMTVIDSNRSIEFYNNSNRSEIDYFNSKIKKTNLNYQSKFVFDLSSPENQ